MKKLLKTRLISTIILALTIVNPLIAEPNSNDVNLHVDSDYVREHIAYRIEKKGTEVHIYLNLKTPEDLDYLFIKRSYTMNGEYSQVKYVQNLDEIDFSSELQIIDKYPLPGNKESYYKIVVVCKKGVMKTYPCVKIKVENENEVNNEILSHVAK